MICGQRAAGIGNSVACYWPLKVIRIDPIGVGTRPTGSNPINYVVRFNKPVTGFSSGAVTLGGTAGATAADVTYAAEVLPYDGTIYNVAVSGMTSPGTVTVSLGADIIKDWHDIFNKPSTSDDNTVTYAP